MLTLNADNLLKLAHDPALFREVLNIEVQGSLVPFGSVAEPWQLADFAAMDPAFLAIAGRGPQVPVRSFWRERCRGGSKSADLAMLGAWTLLFARRPVLLIAAAGDKEQAQIMRDSVARLIAWNPWLSGNGKFLEVQQNRVINKHSGSELRIISSDAPTSYGLTAHAVLVDELSHWAKPDLWESLISTTAKKPGCVTVCILNAGWQDHWLWPIRQAIVDDPSWDFSRQERPPSWISDEELARQKKLLPVLQYERLFENRWVLSAATAFDPKDVDRLVDPNGREELYPQPGWVYFAGLDLAVSRDDAALVVVAKSIGHSTETREELPPLYGPMKSLVDLGIVEGPRPKVETVFHPGTGKYKLAAVRIWKPVAGKIDLSLVEREVLALGKRFKCHIAADPYQASLMMTRLNQQGVQCRGVAFTPQSLQAMGSKTLDVVREKHLGLYPHEELIADIKRLRVTEKPYGFKLEAERISKHEPGTVHCDAGTALQLALYATTIFPAAAYQHQKLVFA